MHQGFTGGLIETGVLKINTGLPTHQVDLKVMGEGIFNCVTWWRGKGTWAIHVGTRSWLETGVV